MNLKKHLMAKYRQYTHIYKSCFIMFFKYSFFNKVYDINT